MATCRREGPEGRGGRGRSGRSGGRGVVGVCVAGETREEQAEGVSRGAEEGSPGCFGAGLPTLHLLPGAGREARRLAPPARPLPVRARHL